MFSFITFIFITVFVDLLGYGNMLPLLPFYGNVRVMRCAFRGDSVIGDLIRFGFRVVASPVLS